MTAKASAVIPLTAHRRTLTAPSRRRFSPAFKCPNVSSIFNQRVDYYCHTRRDAGDALERARCSRITTTIPNSSDSNAHRPVRPARFGRDLWPENALFWGHDRVVGGGQRLAKPLLDHDGDSGYELGASTIDYPLLWRPDMPQLRYRRTQRRSLFQCCVQRKWWLQPSGPDSAWPPTRTIIRMGGDPDGHEPRQRRPPPGTTAGRAYRHTTMRAVCNVAFADGSVRSTTLYYGRILKDSHGDDILGHPIPPLQC
jgi:prepilin-type processing-associated H-X9-DG protein